MSFYAGKYNGNGQCHITKGEDTITTMRGNAVADTVFHSDMNYLTWEIHPVSSFQTTLQHVEGRVYTTTYHTVAHLNSYTTVRNLIRTGRAFAILDANFNIVRGASQFDSTGSTNALLYKESKPYYTKVGWTIGSDLSVEYTNYAGVEDMWMNGYTAAWKYIIVFNVKLNGTMIALPRSGDDIHITDTEFKVSNINILTTKFVQSVNFPGSKAINISGADGTSNAPLYLINYSNGGTGVSISAKAGRTRILNGTNLIIDTAYAMPSVKLSGVYSYYVNATSGTQTSLLNRQYLANFTAFVGKIAVVVTPEGSSIIFKVVAGQVGMPLAQSSVGSIYNGVFTASSKSALVLYMSGNNLYAAGNNWGTSPTGVSYTGTIRIFFLT